MLAGSLVVVSVLFCFVSAINVIEEFQQMRDRWLLVSDLFDEIASAGIASDRKHFLRAHTVAGVLDAPRNRIYAKALISALAPASQQALKRHVEVALAVEFRSRWTAVRSQLDDQLELACVARPEILAPLRVRKMDAFNNITQASYVEFKFESGLVDEYTHAMLMVLTPLVEFPEKGTEVRINKVYDKIDILIDWARKDTSNNITALYRILQRVERSLLQCTHIALPTSVTDAISFTNRQIQALQAVIQTGAGDAPQSPPSLLNPIFRENIYQFLV